MHGEVDHRLYSHKPAMDERKGRCGGTLDVHRSIGVACSSPVPASACIPRPGRNSMTTPFCKAFSFKPPQGSKISGSKNPQGPQTRGERRGDNSRRTLQDSERCETDSGRTILGTLPCTRRSMATVTDTGRASASHGRQISRASDLVIRKGIIYQVDHPSPSKSMGDARPTTFSLTQRLTKYYGRYP